LLSQRGFDDNRSAAVAVTPLPGIAFFKPIGSAYLNRRVLMAKINLARLDVPALLKLRDEIEAVLGQKADELKSQLARLGADVVRKSRRGRVSVLRGRKVARLLVTLGQAVVQNREGCSLG
jgi:hypothetical protein